VDFLRRQVLPAKMRARFTSKGGFCGQLLCPGTMMFCARRTLGFPLELTKTARNDPLLERFSQLVHKPKAGTVFG
jgi:hypothetical protein